MKNKKKLVIQKGFIVREDGGSIIQYLHNFQAEDGVANGTEVNIITHDSLKYLIACKNLIETARFNVDLLPPEDVSIESEYIQSQLHYWSDQKLENNIAAAEDELEQLRSPENLTFADGLLEELERREDEK